MNSNHETDTLWSTNIIFNRVGFIKNAYMNLKKYVSKAKFLNSVPVIVNVNVNKNLESNPRAPTKMGCCRWLSYYVHIYWEDF